MSVLRQDAVMSDVVRARLADLQRELAAPRRLASVPTGEDATVAGEVQPAAVGEPPGVEDSGDESREDGVEIAGAESIVAGRTGERGVREWAGKAWSFGREHLVAVAIVALLGLGFGLFQATQARTVPVTVEPAASAVVTPVASGPATPSPVATVQVHVLGEVRRPGVVKLASGARVHDALEAAGGVTDKARPGSLNLAAPVADGSQIVVGGQRAESKVVDAAGGGAVIAPGGSGGGSSSAPMIDLNTATVEQLDTLPGVGPVTAQAIIAWRTQHGRFSRVEELQEVDGIGPKTYDKLSSLVRVA